MSVRVRCPSCDTMNRLDEEDRGRRVRCRECDARFRVPWQDDVDDDERERPRPARRRESGWTSQHTLMAVLLGGGGLALVLCLGGVGGVAFLLLRAGDRIGRARDRAEAQHRMVAAGMGRIVFDQHGALAFNDPPDPTPELAEVGARMKVHLVHLEAGKTYIISLDSNDFDAYLRVESPAGRPLAEDDDGGGNLNARLEFRPTETGLFRVIATSWDGRVGAFHLTVQEAN